MRRNGGFLGFKENLDVKHCNNNRFQISLHRIQSAYTSIFNSLQLYFLVLKFYYERLAKNKNLTKSL